MRRLMVMGLMLVGATAAGCASGFVLGGVRGLPISAGQATAGYSRHVSGQFQRETLPPRASGIM